MRSLIVESKIMDRDDFKFTKVFVNRPLRLKYVDLAMPEDTSKLKAEEITFFQKIVDTFHNR